MQFLYPAFLWALTALSIPIILHLFYFRRYKKVYFSNLRFLREVKEETSARNRLRNILILIARLLAMASIIMAFAQPFIPMNESIRAGIRNVSVFVDNSFSMQSFGKDLSLFDRSRQKAKEVILGYGQEDHFQVLGHELSPSQSQWISRDEALVRIEEMDYTPLVKPLSIVAARQKQSFSREEGNPVSWMISDFQTSIYDLASQDSLYTINLLPMHGVREKNIAIDSAWFVSPVQSLNQTSSLLFTIHNYAADDADNIRVNIGLDGQERPEGTIDVLAGQILLDTANITILTTGWHTVAIRISDYPVTFDDTYFLSFYVAENLHILNINERSENKKISAVFADPDYFKVETSLANNIPYARFQEFHLIILDELLSIPSGLIAGLKKYVEEGGNVLFVPATDGPLDQYNALLKELGAREFSPWTVRDRDVGRLNSEAFMYKGVFNRLRPNMRLPKVTASFPTSNAGSKGESLLTFRDGGDLLTFYTPGKGAFCVLSSSLEEEINNLAIQPEIFVPLLYNLTLYTSDTKKLSYTIGIDNLVPIDKSLLDQRNPITISGASEFIPGISPMGTKMLIDVSGQVLSSGIYQLIQNDALIAALAFNYDRRESNLAITDFDANSNNAGLVIWDEAEETNFTQLIESNRQGKLLWKWCILFGLLFLGAEIALIRLWKNG